MKNQNKIAIPKEEHEITDEDIKTFFTEVETTDQILFSYDIMRDDLLRFKGTSESLDQFIDLMYDSWNDNMRIGTVYVMKPNRTLSFSIEISLRPTFGELKVKEEHEKLLMGFVRKWLNGKDLPIKVTKEC